MGKGKKENSQSLAAKFEFYSCSGVDLCASLDLVKQTLGLSSGKDGNSICRDCWARRYEKKVECHRKRE